MRLPITFAVVMCLAPAAVAADWGEVDRVEVRRDASVQPAIVYNPDWSIEEFNARRENQNNDRFLLAEADVPRSEIRLRKIVDRPVVFERNGTRFRGEVTSAFVPPASSSSGTVKLRIRIANTRGDSGWQLSSGDAGRLYFVR